MVSLLQQIMNYEPAEEGQPRFRAGKLVRQVTENGKPAHYLPRVVQVIHVQPQQLGNRVGHMYKVEVKGKNKESIWVKESDLDH